MMYRTTFEASKPAVSCYAATRHIYYLSFFSAQFIFQYQLKVYTCLWFQNTLGFSHPGYSLCFVCLFVLQRRHQPSPLKILSQNTIGLFFSKCSLFLRRGIKAVSIINRETFLYNKIGLYVLSKSEMKSVQSQFSDSLSWSNNFLTHCPVIPF